MKQFIVNIMWDALAIVLVRAHDWVFDPQRQARIRMKHRDRWWAYHLKAVKTKSKRDNLRADAWAIQGKFETPPNEVIARGDVKPYPCH